MKKKLTGVLLCSGSFLIAVVMIFSCSKSSSNPSTPTPVFTWSVGGATYAADSDTAFISGPFTIIAKKDASLPGSYKFIEIDLSAFTTGAYTLSAAGANQVNYFTSSGLVVSQSGTLNITANTGTTLSGNFTTTLTGSVAMAGTFTNVPIKP